MELCRAGLRRGNRRGELRRSGFAIAQPLEQHAAMPNGDEHAEDDEVDDERQLPLGREQRSDARGESLQQRRRASPP